ncbi:hypothetical protein T01_4322 [Trichinella spiralis]|uniref:Uncharacterized protein n=1 Tax=Trichinella spiralis TaxID=6334 RepID=A0A0V1AXS0_TRISP|nr:hypothetical protein T01_4322 [Trichinella spiralis]
MQLNLLLLITYYCQYERKKTSSIVCLYNKQASVVQGFLICFHLIAGKSGDQWLFVLAKKSKHSYRSPLDKAGPSRNVPPFSFDALIAV